MNMTRNRFLVNPAFTFANRTNGRETGLAHAATQCLNPKTASVEHAEVSFVQDGPGRRKERVPGVDRPW